MITSSFFTPVLLSGLLCLVGTAVFFAIRHYLPLHKTPLYVTIPVFIAVATSASAIVLVPLDVASTDTTHFHWLFTISPAALFVLWRTCYWMTFALTWVILPGIGEYVDSGFHETRDRISYSIRSNMKYHLTICCIGLLFALYFFSAAGFRLNSFKALVMAGSYAWGLLLACYLMGHGLVAFPRHYFRQSSPSSRLLTFQRTEVEVRRQLADAEVQFAQRAAVVAHLAQQKSRVQSEFVLWITKLEAEVQAMGIRVRSDIEPYVAVPSTVTKDFLAEVSRDLRLAANTLSRFSVEQERIQTTILELERALRPISPSEEPRLWRGIPQPVWNDRPVITYYIIPYLHLLFAFVLSFFSAMIVISQTVALFDPSSTPVALFTARFHGYWLLPVLMFHTALSAISTLPRLPLGFWRSRTLTPGATALEPAVWFASQVARLSMPLALNYSSLLPQKVYREMMFYKFLGEKVDLTPIGGAFAKFAPPTVVLLAMLAALGGTYGWVGSWFKSPVDEDEDWVRSDGPTSASSTSSFFGARHRSHDSGSNNRSFARSGVGRLSREHLPLTDTPPPRRPQSNHLLTSATFDDPDSPLESGADQFQYHQFADVNIPPPLSTPTRGGLLPGPSNESTPSRTPHGRRAVANSAHHSRTSGSGPGAFGGWLRGGPQDDSEGGDGAATATTGRLYHRPTASTSSRRTGHSTRYPNYEYSDDPGGDDPSWFSGFATRVRNTIDTATVPAWLQFGDSREGAIRLEEGNAGADPRERHRDDSISDRLWPWLDLFGTARARPPPPAPALPSRPGNRGRG